jgi:hypothetical protein
MLGERLSPRDGGNSGLRYKWHFVRIDARQNHEQDFPTNPNCRRQEGERTQNTSAYPRDFQEGIFQRSVVVHPCVAAVDIVVGRCKVVDNPEAFRKRRPFHYYYELQKKHKNQNRKDLIGDSA